MRVIDARPHRRYLTSRGRTMEFNAVELDTLKQALTQLRAHHRLTGYARGEKVADRLLAFLMTGMFRLPAEVASPPAAEENLETLWAEQAK